MADDVQGGVSPRNEPEHVDVKEDAETRATRRELKQSSISDRATEITQGAAGDDNGAQLSRNSDENETVRPETPTTTDAQNAHDEEDLIEQVGSPKRSAHTTN